VAGQIRDLDQQRYKLVEQGLEAAVDDKLIEITAAARGMAPETFMAAEVDAKVRPATEAEVEEFFQQRKDQIQQPLEVVAPQIRQYLEQTRRQEVLTQLMTSLREEHKPVILLEPIRIEVETSGAPAVGPASAPVTIVEFSDFQCPFCSRLIPTLERITESYPEAVRLVFRQFPLNSIHPQAQKAAEASLCANDQGRFWEMHDALFANQEALSIADLKATAARLELDTAAFAQCLEGGQHEDQVNQDLEEGIAAGVSGTPALFINGRFLSGAQPYDAIAKVIDDELLRASR
jgi:protein-disulfide isomerase